MAKKNARPSKVPPPSAEPPFVRIELHASPDFLRRLDEARKKRGLSRSAYLRQAALLMMDQDEGGK